jgi:hypothetical protein
MIWTKHSSVGLARSGKLFEKDPTTLRPGSSILATVVRFSNTKTVICVTKVSASMKR